MQQVTEAASPAPTLLRLILGNRQELVSPTSPPELAERIARLPGELGGFMPGVIWLRRSDENGFRLDYGRARSFARIEGTVSERNGGSRVMITTRLHPVQTVAMVLAILLLALMVFATGGRMAFSLLSVVVTVYFVWSLLQVLRGCEQILTQLTRLIGSSALTV